MPNFIMSRKFWIEMPRENFLSSTVGLIPLNCFSVWLETMNHIDFQEFQRTWEHVTKST